MEWYKGTEHQCINYDVFVTSNEKYVKGDNWANAVEIDGSWYILKHDNYTTDLELINELPPQNLDII